MLDIDTCRSYATEANLTAALAKLGLVKYGPLVVRNRTGRWTAVFRFGVVKEFAFGIASHGFIVMG